MPPISSWPSRLVLALLTLQLASACDPNPPPPPPPPADTTPPSTRATPQGGTFKADVSVTMLCEDGTGSGCDATYYTTDGSTPSTSSARYSAPVVLTQNTTLKFFSTDKAGNAEAAQSLTFVVDKAAPTTTATPAGSIYNAVQSVVLACDDGTGTGCAATHYTTDGSEPTTGSPRYTAALSITANTTLKYFSVDTAGNAETVNTSTYVIDTVAPTTTATPTAGTYDEAQSVTLACTDGTGTGCAATHYTTDGSEPTTSSPRYTAPLSIATSTTLKFFSVDMVGNAEAVHTETYVIDTVAPTTTATPAGGLYNAAQSVVLACADGTGSGCAATHYTLDGSEPSTGSLRYTAAISIAANTTLKFLSVDTAGNAEAVRTETYVIDTVAPTTTATPAAGRYEETQSVTLACTDGTGSGCAATHYTLDGSEPSTGSPRYTAPLSIEANTTLKFFSVDRAGNAESVKTADYIINTSIPTVSASPAGGLYRTAQSVTLNCNPGATGGTCVAIYYTTNGSTPSTSSATYSAPIDVDVTTTIKFFAENSVGNSSSIHTETYRIDEGVPTTTAIPSGRAYKEAQSVTLLCADGTGSGCTATYYTRDGSTPTRSSSTYSAPLSISANTTLKFFSVDAAGNEETVRTQSYVIDTVKPTVAAAPAGGFYNSARDITLTCTDNTSGSGCDTLHYTTDGSTPDTGSATYSAPITLSADTTLKFVAVDKVGNVSTVRTEVYTFDTAAPTTTATPAGGLYTSVQSVTLACADDARGIGCANTYYTLNGSTPTTGSTRYTGPISLTANTTLKFFSVDKADNAESVRTETYTIATPANVSAQIATIRARANGSISEFIDYALVTYTKPLTGSSDPAGFFLQSEKNGPALFVAVDPTTLSPAPKVGDRVRIRATEKMTVSGLVQVTKLDSVTVHSSGESVEPLLNDVSNVDLVANLNNYESEFISVNGTVASTFATASTGHVSASFVTLGNTSVSANLRLRLTTPVQDELDVAQDCSVTAKAPLWRFGPQAQPSAWAAGDLTVLSCPAPKMTSAAAISSTSVVVNFDRRIDPASVLADGSQFTFDPGLVASSATVSGRQVQLTTTSQVAGTPYMVTVASSVKDTLGGSIGATANSATFDGYVKLARLLINEVNPAISGSRDLLELLVVEGGSVNKMTVTVDGTAAPVATMPNVQVETGDIIVVHFAPAAGDVSETTAKDQIKAPYNYDTAWDFIGNSSGLSFSHRVIRVRDSASITMDAVPFVVASSTSPPGAFPGQLQTLQGEGLWFPADCSGAPCSTNALAVSVSVDYGGAGATATGKSVQRKAGANTHQKSDWVLVTASSFGLPNTP
ncbi:MAG TPA: chitobiase/beta-hexosaminidase C-terminal domain-containing protein [Archangium sp.]|nr:chitobiase/beta-hexosaminidase C-terminal domain-containing protein [Archangium sp.]